jgi:hypothetical protein
LRDLVPEATPSVLHGTRFGPLGAALHEAKAMLDLREAQLQLLELVATDEPELAEEALEALAGTLREARCVAPPPHDCFLDQLPDVVTPHPAPLGELARQLIDAFGSQCDGAHRREAEPLGQLAR